MKAAKAKEKDSILTDGNGLQIRVRINGHKLWNFNYIQPVTKKLIIMGLGSFPEVSLAQARKRTVEARELVSQGLDPKEKRDAERHLKKAATEHTFENISKARFELKKDFVTPAYAEDIWRSLTLHVFPDLATTPISSIHCPLSHEFASPTRDEGQHRTIKRLTQRLNEIMTYPTGHFASIGVSRLMAPTGL